MYNPIPKIKGLNFIYRNLFLPKNKWSIYSIWEFVNTILIPPMEVSPQKLFTSHPTITILDGCLDKEEGHEVRWSPQVEKKVRVVQQGNL